MLSCSFFLLMGNPWGHPATIRAGNGALETLHDAVYFLSEKAGHSIVGGLISVLIETTLNASESGPVDLAQKLHAGRQKLLYFFYFFD